jgi:hypothetical protein
MGERALRGLFSCAARNEKTRENGLILIVAQRGAGHGTLVAIRDRDELGRRDFAGVRSSLSVQADSPRDLA